MVKVALCMSMCMGLVLSISGNLRLVGTLKHVLFRHRCVSSRVPIIPSENVEPAPSSIPELLLSRRCRCLFIMARRLVRRCNGIPSQSLMSTTIIVVAVRRP